MPRRAGGSSGTGEAGKGDAGKGDAGRADAQPRGRPRTPAPEGGACPQDLTYRWAQNLPVLLGACRRMNQGPQIQRLNLGPSRTHGLSASLPKTCLPGVGG